MNEELLAAIRSAILESEASSGFPEALLTVQAEAAAKAMLELGYFKAAGTEYAVRRDGITLEHGFNTEAQAQAWAADHHGADIESRPVGVWSKKEGSR